MNIPIRFKFFDKLKLYQDYLKKDSMLERTKPDYWLYEKSILLWAYSQYHQHLGVKLNTNTLKHRSKLVSDFAKVIGQNNYSSIRWVEKNVSKEEALQRIIENLTTLELADKIDSTPEIFTVNLKGFLLGELLFETYENPSFWSKNFRKYRLALFVFYATFIVLLLTVPLIFLNQLFELVKPEVFGIYVGRLFGYSWWSTTTTVFMIYLGLKQIWKRL